MIKDNSYYLSVIKHILFFVALPLYFGLKLVQGEVTVGEQKIIGWILIILSLIIGIWAIKNHKEEYKDHFRLKTNKKRK